MTGDRYYAEEMAFWANYAMVRTDPGDGIRGSLGILASNEVRGYGWALRNLVDAAVLLSRCLAGEGVSLAEGDQQSPVAERLCRRAEPEDQPVPDSVDQQAKEGGQYIALWEQSYLAHAIDRANQQGFAGGLAHRDAIARFQLRLFGASPIIRARTARPICLRVGTAKRPTPPRWLRSIRR